MGKRKSKKGGCEMSPQDIMTAEDVASILHVKVTTLYDWRWREKAGCPLFHQGRRLFSYKRKFDDWYRNRLTYA